MTITLVTVVGRTVTVLPQMLRHYQSLGVDAISVNVNMRDRDDPVFEEAVAIAGDAGADVDSVTIGPWTTRVNPAIYHSVRAVRSSDWFILADQDELQTYPADLRDLLKDADARGYEYLEGAFVDRLAKDGTFAAIEPAQGLFEQFPLGGFLSLPLLAAAPWKVVAVKAHIVVGSGQHTASGLGQPIEECFVQVHHFKWIKGVIERLRERMEHRRSLGEPHWEECARFLAYCDQHGGRIDVADPRFYLTPCGSTYHHWQMIRSNLSRLRRAAQFPDHPAQWVDLPISSP